MRGRKETREQQGIEAPDYRTGVLYHFLSRAFFRALTTFALFLPPKKFFFQRHAFFFGRFDLCSFRYFGLKHNTYEDLATLHSPISNARILNELGRRN